MRYELYPQCQKKTPITRPPEVLHFLERERYVKEVTT